MTNQNILPKMIQLSNNSQITKSISTAIENKFTKQEQQDFLIWLFLIESSRQTKINKTVHNFMRGK